MAAVVFTLLKSRSFVMLGTMFWYMKEDRSKGTADPTADANPPGFVPGATKVPTGSKTLAMLGIRRVAKLKNTTITTAFAILLGPTLLCRKQGDDRCEDDGADDRVKTPSREEGIRQQGAGSDRTVRKEAAVAEQAGPGREGPQGVEPQGRANKILEAARHLALGQLVKADGHVRQEEARDEVVNVQAW